MKDVIVAANEIMAAANTKSNSELLSALNKHITTLNTAKDKLQEAKTKHLLSLARPSLPVGQQALDVINNF